MREISINANKNGLVSEISMTGHILKNMLIVKDALTGLLSSEDDFLVVLGQMPAQIRQVCETRRK